MRLKSKCRISRIIYITDTQTAKLTQIILWMPVFIMYYLPTLTLESVFVILFAVIADFRPYWDLWYDHLGTSGLFRPSALHKLLLVVFYLWEPPSKIWQTRFHCSIWYALIYVLLNNFMITTSYDRYIFN